MERDLSQPLITCLKTAAVFLLHRFRDIQRRVWTLKVRMTCATCGDNLTVNFRSHAGRNVHLGHNVNFNGIQISPGGLVTIGNNFHSGRGCQFIVRYHNYDRGAKLPYDDTYINKPIEIGDNVWLGHDVTVLGGITIGEGAVLQAGSVVVTDIPPLSVAGGNPAKVFKHRDHAHYYRLKAEGKTH